MEYRRLGKTGLKVSVHCLGTMMFGQWGNPDHDESVRTIQAALDGGINFIDTADVYSAGESEEIVGKAIKDRRDEIVLATKAHGRMGQNINEAGNSRFWLMKEVENSLRRLGTDHIDLYQIHRSDPKTDIQETLGALTDLVHQGKVRYLGCSTFPAHSIVESHWVSEKRGLERFVCEQPPYSIFTRHIELDVLPVCQEYGMGVIVWSPLDGGWLTGKYRQGQDIPEGSRAERAAKQWASPVAQRFDMTRDANQRKLQLVDELALIADKAGISMTHMANAWVLRHPAVTSAIIGPRTMEQMTDLLEGADVVLSDEILDAIDEVVEPGLTLEVSNRGWAPPWMKPEARRR